MLRDRQYKYVHYVNEPPQLFNLVTDPDECRDLAMNPNHQSILHDFDQRLNQILDPVAANEQAHQDQAECIERNGGETAVRARGAFDNSPVPGEAPAFRVH